MRLARNLQNLYHHHSALTTGISTANSNDITYKHARFYTFETMIETIYIVRHAVSPTCAWLCHDSPSEQTRFH